MDIQLASLSQAFSGKKLIVNHSRLMRTVKSILIKSKYFNVLFYADLVRLIYEPFTLTIIMSTQTSLTDCCKS